MRYVHPDDVLRELVGQRCEAIDNPYGSVIRLDIGPMGHRPGETDARPHGWRHLTIFAPWRLESRSEVVGDWNLPGGFHGTIVPAVQRLLADTISAARSAPPGWDLVLDWSSGLRLVVFSDRTEDRDDAWAILGTDNVELGVGLAMPGETGYKLTAD